MLENLTLACKIVYNCTKPGQAMHGQYLSRLSQRFQIQTTNQNARDAETVF